MQVHYGIEDLHIANPVLTIGSFDGVHKGHVQVINSLKKVAQNLAGESVIISFEPHPREVIYPQEKRLGILTTLEEKVQILERIGVDHLIILQFIPALADLEYSDFVKCILVDKIGIKGLLIGYDHRFGKNRAGTFDKLKELAEKHHFYLEQEDVYEENDINISSTKIRNALQIGAIEHVNTYLGYSYSILGTVVVGDKIGRSIGYPTANIQLRDERKLLPVSGVYAVDVVVEGKEHKGMLNIGTRPTVSYSGELRVEVHIFDFNKDIYGKNVNVFFKARIRGERKFDSVNDLQQQLSKDMEKIKEL